jgi:hypothetical protein
MGYRGKTYDIPCNRGGLSHNQNTDLIPPEMVVSPSRNINLHEGGRRKRGGTAKVNGTAVSGSPRIMGGFDFQLPTSSFQVFMGKDGKLYKNSTTTIKTGMSTANKASFAVFGNELYVCDGDTTPQTWDGAAAGTSDITTPAADWTGSEQPFQVISHGRGASRRTWFLYASAAYYSSLGNGKVVSGGTSGKISIDVPDAFGLVGGVEFQNRLFLFSRDKTFLITDDDPSVATWGYEQAGWFGGVAHWRLIVKTPNDLVLMMEDGEIYSISAVQSYGDYKRASIARPAFIDNYIRENIDLSYIDDFHACYDQKMRAIKFFMVRVGQTVVDTALVYFIDRPPEEAWAIHDNQNTASGYKASCSFMVRASTGNYVMYTGDYSGFVWKLEQTTRSDDGNAYYGGFKTPNLPFDNPRVKKHYRRAYVIAKTQGNYNLSVNVWIDGSPVISGGTISLSGTGGVLDTDVLDSFVLGGTEFLDRYFELGYYGKRIQFEFYNSGAGQDFFVSQILIDHKVIGALP